MGMGIDAGMCMGIVTGMGIRIVVVSTSQAGPDSLVST